MTNGPSDVELRLSERAIENLSAIRIYTTNQHGLRQAARYRGQLEQGFASLRRFPGIGLAHRELPRGHQAFRVAHHWVCYEVNGDIIEIKAIIRQLSEFDL